MPGLRVNRPARSRLESKILLFVVRPADTAQSPNARPNRRHKRAAESRHSRPRAPAALVALDAVLVPEQGQRRAPLAGSTTSDYEASAEPASALKKKLTDAGVDQSEIDAAVDKGEPLVDVRRVSRGS